MRDKIDERVSAATELLAEADKIVDATALDDLRRRQSSWTEFNDTLLATSFDGPIDREYRGLLGSIRSPWARELTLLEKRDELRKDIEEKIRRLESIRDRLELFEGPPHVQDVSLQDGLPGLDPALWEHVRTAGAEEQWPQAASAAATFVESKIREWSRLGPDKFGKDLITSAMRPNASSSLELGCTDGEKEGWHLLAMGFIAALGNVDRHRVQNRTDLRRYALGVLYAASLLLTQIRYQHPDRTR